MIAFLVVGAIAFVILYSLVYCFKKTVFQYRVQSNFASSKNVALVIAHPDDEVMFFAPTIHNVLKFISVDKFLILSITSGNYNGIGNTRRNELKLCCKELCIKEENVLFLEENHFLDDPSHKWDIQQLKLELEANLKKNNVDMVITFGEYGVSGHSNHQDTHTVMKSLQNLKVFFLEDVNILRKYSSIFDVLFTCIIAGVLQRKLVLISSPWEVYKTYCGMKCHQSQFVWFRKLYFLFSRYIMVNQLSTVHHDKTQ